MNTPVLIIIVVLCSGCIPGSPGGQPNRNLLISGGKVTSPSSVPWNAALYWSVDAGYEQFCGGTLITQTFVLTAAHCLHGLKSSDMRVALGKFNRAYYDTAGEDVQYLFVSRVLVYPRYDYYEGISEFDIALVELAAPANLSSFVQPARVDFTPGFLANDTNGTVAGWGLTENGFPSEKLRSVALPYVDPETCYRTLVSGNRHYLTADKFCAGFVNESVSVCDGDSGAGFVVKDPETAQFFVRGVVSVDLRPSDFPYGRCYNMHYTGFTHIGQELYLNWLNEKVPQLKTAALTTDCGRQLNVTTEVVRGRNVTVGDQPWHVVVYKRGSGSSWSYRCVGTLITPSHVVTAANWLTDRAGRALPASSWRLRAGKLYVQYNIAEPDSQTREVGTVQLHPQFNAADNLHDIALLEADSSFQLSWRTSPACVDWTGRLPVQTYAVVTARTRDFVLVEQPFTLIARGQALREAEPVNIKYIQSDTICARQAGENTCHSAEGVGLMMRHTDTRGAVSYYLRGLYSALLASTRRDGCQYDRIIAFTDLSPYTTWLQQHVA